MADARPSQHELDANADDDEALRQAIALSLEEQHKTTAALISHEKDADKPTFGTLPLDRRQMEQERLQRLAKRRRVSSGDDVVEVPPPKKPAPSKPSSQSAAALPFPNGTIKRTWARGYPRTPDDIKIEEVLQKDQLILAVLSSFQWDEEWIMSKVDLATTKLLLLAFASDDAQVRSIRSRPAIMQPLIKAAEGSDAVQRAARHQVLLPPHERPWLHALQTAGAQVPWLSSSGGADG